MLDVSYPEIGACEGAAGIFPSAAPARGRGDGVKGIVYARKAGI